MPVAMAKLLAAGAVMALAVPAQAEWVASWAASPHAPLGTQGPFAAGSFDNVTITQIVRLSEGGRKLRLRLSNRYGPAPLEVGEVRVVQIDAAGNEVAGTARALTFGGQKGAVIPRGSPFVSDAVDVDLPDLARLKVEMFLPKPTGPCTCHLTGMDTLAVSPPGNFVGQPFTPVATAQYRAFISAIEIDSPDARGTIVTFGDSITGLEWAVANAAISGNRVLSPGMGEAALARFDEDVLSLPNVKAMIVFEGVNDIGNRFGTRTGGPQLPGMDQPQIDAAQMIVGYQQLIARAHARGIRVIGSPIGPYKGASYWTEEGEAARQTINDWIVNGGAFDGVVRLDTAFADPADPRQMRDGYHMGDHLHGSDAGLKAVGDSIDLKLFRNGEDLPAPIPPVARRWTSCRAGPAVSSREAARGRSAPDPRPVHRRSTGPNSWRRDRPPRPRCSLPLPPHRLTWG
jgi:lysophospholipase L1-like esterase